MDFWVMQFQNYERAIGRGIGGEGSRQKSLMPTMDSVARDALTFAYTSDRLEREKAAQQQDMALQQLRDEQESLARPESEANVLQDIAGATDLP
jgi:hypothetical protein